MTSGRADREDARLPRGACGPEEPLELADLVATVERSDLIVSLHPETEVFEVLERRRVCPEGEPGARHAPPRATARTLADRGTSVLVATAQRRAVLRRLGMPPRVSASFFESLLHRNISETDDDQKRD